MLDGSITVDHRLLSDSGRAEIVQEQKDIPENSKIIAGSTATGVLLGGSAIVGLLDENGTVKDATTLTQNNADAAYDAELAANLQLIQEGINTNVVDNQSILNQYNQGLIDGTSINSTEVNLTDGLYNVEQQKVDATTNISNKTDIYLDTSAQNNSIELITHENAHQAGFGETGSSALGKRGEAAFNVNAWVNVEEIETVKTTITQTPKVEVKGVNDAQAQLDLLNANKDKQQEQIVAGDEFENYAPYMDPTSDISLENIKAGANKSREEIINDYELQKQLAQKGYEFAAATILPTTVYELIPIGKGFGLAIKGTKKVVAVFKDSKDAKKTLEQAKIENNIYRDDDIISRSKLREQGLKDAEKVSTATNPNNIAKGQVNQPRNLQEQIVWNDILKNPTSGRELRNLNGDGRFPQDAGFVKMEKIVKTSEGKNITIHYQYNNVTKKTYDMKIINKPLNDQ